MAEPIAGRWKANAALKVMGGAELSATSPELHASWEGPEEGGSRPPGGFDNSLAPLPGYLQENPAVWTVRTAPGVVLDTGPEGTDPATHTVEETHATDTGSDDAHVFAKSRSVKFTEVVDTIHAETPTGSTAQASAREWEGSGSSAFPIDDPEGYNRAGFRTIREYGNKIWRARMNFDSGVVRDYRAGTTIPDAKVTGKGSRYTSPFRSGGWARITRLEDQILRRTPTDYTAVERHDRDAHRADDDTYGPPVAGGVWTI